MDRNPFEENLNREETPQDSPETSPESENAPQGVQNGTPDAKETPAAAEPAAQSGEFPFSAPDSAVQNSEYSFSRADGSVPFAAESPYTPPRAADSAYTPPLSQGFYDPYRPSASSGAQAGPSGYTAAPSYSAGAPYTPPIYEQKPKKRRTGLLVLLCIALFALGIGAGFGVHYLSEADVVPGDLPTQGIQGVEDELSEDNEAEFEAGTFAPVYGDEENTFSAAEVYAASVNGVVGISTEITSQNVFGQQTAYAVSGTGFVFSSDGYILTNCHIVEGANAITVTMYDGTEYEARLVGKDSQNDVAVLKIEPTAELTVLKMGNSSEMVVGEEILVIGNPLGELTYTLTRGIVSNLSREITTEDSMTPIRMFQTDAAINNGNSGGPAIDCHGNVIGIVSAKYASSSIEGLGFCIPIDDAMAIAQDLIEHGYVQGRPYLGIEGQAVSGYAGSSYISGVQVTSVLQDSCAEKAGIQRGDIITHLAGTQTPTATELKSALSAYKAGDTVELTVYRNRETVLVTVVLDEASA